MNLDEVRAAWQPVTTDWIEAGLWTIRGGTNRLWNREIVAAPERGREGKTK